MPGSSLGEQARYFLRLSLTVPEEVIDVACARIFALADRLCGKKERRA